jgi:hypothetical protein
MTISPPAADPLVFWAAAPEVIVTLPPAAAPALVVPAVAADAVSPAAIPAADDATAAAAVAVKAAAVPAPVARAALIATEARFESAVFAPPAGVMAIVTEPPVLSVKVVLVTRIVLTSETDGTPSASAIVSDEEDAPASQLAIPPSYPKPNVVRMTVATEVVASFPLSPLARTRSDRNGEPMTVDVPYRTSVSLVAYDETIVSETYSVVSVVVDAREQAEYGLTSRVSVML